GADAGGRQDSRPAHDAGRGPAARGSAGLIRLRPAVFPRVPIPKSACASRVASPRARGAPAEIRLTTFQNQEYGAAEAGDSARRREPMARSVSKSTFLPVPD